MPTPPGDEASPADHEASPADGVAPPDAATAPPEDTDLLRYELVLAAADDLGQVGSAYQAEMIGSALLGSVYAVAGGDRARALEQFTTGFRRFLAGRDGATAGALRAVLDSLASPGVVSPPHQSPPPWGGQLATVSATGAWAYGDVYGDQVTYLATFAYADPSAGGPEHAVAVLVDRNLGIAKDLYVAAPASAVVDRLRASAEADDAAYFEAVEPARTRAAVAPYLTAADSLASLPDDGSFGVDRALAGARLRSLPESPDEAAPVTDDDPVVAFRDSAEARRLVGAPGDAASLAFCLDLIQRFAASRADRDPLRWSPTAAAMFLLEWVPRHAILDQVDRRLLPRVLDAWVRWAGRLSGLSPAAVAATVVGIARLRPQFAERIGRDELRSPQAQAVAQMLADGVDLDDESAVARWIEEYNAREH